MSIVVPESREPFIRDLVRSGAFASETEVVEEALQLLEARVREAASGQRATISAHEMVGPTRRKPIWERAAELRKRVPAEEWDKVPADGSKQLDHYIYGSPRRNDS